jgi:hypothetical protein
VSNFFSNKLKLSQPVRHDISSKREMISVECDANLVMSGDAIASGESTAVGDGESDRLQDKTCQFHYVPIFVSLKNYHEQPNVWASCNQAQFDEGRWNSLALCNPLGNKRDSKMSAFYFLVGNLETGCYGRANGG